MVAAQPAYRVVLILMLQVRSRGSGSFRVKPSGMWTF
ncbi:hypothetical protein E2C01_028129 [Portunus trituberculatus]|uniref:Uncharacterized protein n=1 Tax=Portunus trituberculatus TaxID=210409 RepID=A0A5B7EN27_PORTR|nr:hypothetical protein [Portunus trituberculatus]